MERRDRLENPHSEGVRKVSGLSRRSVRSRTGRILVEGAPAVSELLSRITSSEESVGSIDLYLQDDLPTRITQGILALAASIPLCFVHAVSSQVSKALAPNSQGIVAVARREVLPLVTDDVWSDPGPGMILILPATQDPGNVGTLIRLADGAGARAVLLGQDCADLASPKVIRASAGSVFHLPVTRYVEGESLGYLRRQGWQIWGIDLRGNFSLRQLRADNVAYAALKTAKIAIVLGNEAHGLDERVLCDCDRLVRIDMYGQAESLNVAAAGALTLFTVADAQYLLP